MACFTTPREIHFGRGCLDVLKTIEGNKAFIVSYAVSDTFKRMDVVDKALEYLKEAGIETYIFEEVEADPSIETVNKGAAAMREFEPDLIIPIGGGSCIDASKSMWILYEHPDAILRDCHPYNMPKLRNKAKLIAIPTTSGTASEVTNASVICDNAAGVKFGVAGSEIIPDAAILDPDIAASMPLSLLAFTGLDALVHAIESYLSKFASPFTDANAVHSFKLVMENLEAAYNGDDDAKEAMHYAANLAGLAFCNCMLGINHSLAHSTGAVFEMGHIPHGLANAINLPYVIQYNSKNERAKKRYAELAKSIGINGTTEDELLEALLNKIRDLRSKLGIPNKLSELNIPEDELNSKIAYIADNAMKDDLTMATPRDIDNATMEKVLRYIYDGTDIDF